MEITVIILFGCTTAADDKGHEYNIQDVTNASPHCGTIESGGILFEIKKDERYNAVTTGLHSVQLAKAI